MNNLKLIFLFNLFYFTFLGWSSNSWILIWLMMEIIFLFFVGYSLVEVNYSSVEFMMKYYIIQVFISLLFSFFMIVSFFNLKLFLNLGLLFCLIMKLGMFPFHFWLISVLGKLEWVTFFLLMTVVKLLPVLLVYYFSSLVSLSVVLLTSSICGSVLGLSNILIQKLLGYSSLVHLCWFILTLLFSVKIFMIYVFCYFCVMLFLIFFFKSSSIFYTNQFKVFTFSLFVKFVLFFLILSLAGFPPFLGFVIKWVVISSLIQYNIKFLLFLMLSFSLFSVVYYLELFYYIMLLNSLSVFWTKCFAHSFNIFFFFMLSFYFFLYVFI